MVRDLHLWCRVRGRVNTKQLAASVNGYGLVKVSVRFRVRVRVQNFGLVSVV